MIVLFSLSQQLNSHLLFKTPQNLLEEQSELMDSILQIHQKMDLVSGFIKFYKMQIIETHSRVTTLHSYNTMLQTIQFKTICLVNAFTEKNCAY